MDHSVLMCTDSNSSQLLFSLSLQTSYSRPVMPGLSHFSGEEIQSMKRLNFNQGKFYNSIVQKRMRRIYRTIVLEKLIAALLML